MEPFLLLLFLLSTCARHMLHQVEHHYSSCVSVVFSDQKVLLEVLLSVLITSAYYHLRSTVKRERFFANIYFSNETVSQTTVSTVRMKMFRLEHETMNVCQRNVARFGHVE